MDATYAKGKSRADLVEHYSTVMGVHDAMPTQIMPQDHAFALLDAYGADVILNHMSMGWTATEIASHFKVPSMAYAKWVEKRLPPEDVRIATRNFADALVTRAMYVLGHRHASPQEQSSMKQLSKVARDLAACASPDQWMPGRIAGASAAPLSAVAINIDIGTGLAQSMRTSGVSSYNVPPSASPPPPGGGLLPSPEMPAPPATPSTAPAEAIPPGGVTMGWIFGDTAPTPDVAGVAGGNPPTRERPNG